MERTQVLELMGNLKLYGMRVAYDEIMGNAIKRKHEPPRIVGDLLTAVNGGAIPGQRDGVKAGHLGESGATQQGARSGSLPCRRLCLEDQGLLISPVSGSTVSAMAWFCSARSAGVAGRRRPADCFRR